MSNIKNKKKWYQKLFNFQLFIITLLSECLEAVLEDLLATCLSWIAIKILNITFAIVLTQGTKVLMKKIFKCIVYKEGNDKVKKAKTFFKNVKEKLTKNIIWSNKITISGWLSVLIMFLEGTDVIDILNVLPTISIAGFNIMPYLLYIVLTILSMLGIGKPGIESVKQYLTRVAAKEKCKENKEKEKEKQKEIEKQLKQLQDQQRATLEAQARAIVEANQNNQ